MAAPRMVELRIPDHPDTGEVRWRLCGVTPNNNQILVCLGPDDTDFNYNEIIDVVRGEDVWNWRPYWSEPNDEPPKVA